jgi:hypothetical protein
VVRRGGGNLGIVTSFDYRLHPVGPIIMAGAVIHPFNQGGEVLRFYRDWAAGQPDEVTPMAAVVTAPPASYVPRELHHRPVVDIVAAYAGPLDREEAHLRPKQRCRAPAPRSARSPGQLTNVRGAGPSPIGRRRTATG